MKIILSKQCASLTGSLGRGFGYYIKTHQSKNGKPRFFSQRSKHQVPHDGHLRFIFTFFDDDKSPDKKGGFYPAHGAGKTIFLHVLRI